MLIGKKMGINNVDGLDIDPNVTTVVIENMQRNHMNENYNVIIGNLVDDVNEKYVKLYTNKLDKVGSIQEIPSMNIAEVSVTYKKEDKTPFYDVLEKDKTDFNTKKIALRKTENNGWIYCEK